MLLVIDGRPSQLQGWLTRVDAPPAAPWLLIGIPFIAATALLLARGRRHLPVACLVFGSAAVVATFAIGAGFGASNTASTGRMLEGFDETVFACVGAAFLVRGQGDRRAIAAVALGLLAVIVGGLKVAALAHGVVLSSFPATAARTGVAIALWAGAAALTCGSALLATLQNHLPGEHRRWPERLFP